MIRPSKTFLLFASAALFLTTSNTSAQTPPPTISVLDLDFENNVPELVQKSILSSLQDAVIKHKSGLRYRSWPATVKLLKQSKDSLSKCFDKDCLIKSGELTRSPIGLSSTIAGEAQIYDFEVSIYNLYNGKRLIKETGSCDICTPKETGEVFKKAVINALSKIDIPKPPRAISKTPKPSTITKTSKPENAINVDVVVFPEAAALLIGDRPLGEGSASTQLGPGEYTLSASAEGFEPVNIPLKILPAQKGPLQLRLFMAPAGVEGVQLPSEASTGALDGPGWISVAVGGLSAVAGGLLLSVDGNTTCSSGTDAQCPYVYDTAGGGAALLAVGSASITTGLFLLFWDELNSP